MAEQGVGRGEAGLQVLGLGHSYGQRRVLEDVSLSLPRGEIHCLVGASGCGKSTTLRLVAGLEEVREGRILIAGRVVAGPGVSLPPERRRVGLMFQDFALFPHLTVEENVAFGLRRRDRGGRAARVGGMLARVAMTTHARAFPDTLSGGEQQRVALARALAPEPDLVLLDEAFSALDTGLRGPLREDILGVLRDNGTPTLLVTHDPDEAVQVGDRLHVMREGRIVQSGVPAELYARPVDPFVAGFFGPVNRLRGRIAGGRVETGLGPVPAAGLPEGLVVELVARPEAVRLRPAGTGGGPRAWVVGRHDLGPSRSIRLRLADGAAICVRDVRPDGADVGDEVEIDLDPRHVFVYPAAG